MHVLLLVVRKGSVRNGGAHHFLGDERFLLGTGQVTGKGQRVQRASGIATRKREDGLAGIIGKLEGTGKTLIRAERAVQDAGKRIIGEPVQLDHARAGDKRGVHLEERVLGRGAYEHDHAVFHRMEQSILLRPIEAVDLVDEQDGTDTQRHQALVGFGNFPAKIGNGSADRGNLDEVRMRRFGNDVRNRGFASAGGSIQDDR